MLADALLEHHRRVAEAVDHIDMRAGIGGADQGAVVAPQLGAERDCFMVVAAELGREDRHQPVRESDVEHDVDRRAGLLAGDIADQPALMGLVDFGGNRRDDVIVDPRGEAENTGAAMGLGIGGELEAELRIAQLLHPVFNRPFEHLAPAARNAVEDHPAVEVHIDGSGAGQGERQHLAAPRAGIVGQCELAGGLCALARLSGQHQYVPVYRPLSGERESGDQFRRVGIEIHPRQQFEAGARMFADHFAKRDQFLLGGPARGNGVAVAIIVTGGERRGETERAFGQRLTEQRFHRLQFIGGG